MNYARPYLLRWYGLLVCNNIRLTVTSLVHVSPCSASILRALIVNALPISNWYSGLGCQAGLPSGALYIVIEQPKDPGRGRNADF